MVRVLYPHHLAVSRGAGKEPTPHFPQTQWQTDLRTMTELLANLTQRLAAYPKWMLNTLRPFRPRALTIRWQARWLLVLGGTLASLSQFHLAKGALTESDIGHPFLFYCVVDSFVYSFTQTINRSFIRSPFLRSFIHLFVDSLVRSAISFVKE